MSKIIHTLNYLKTLLTPCRFPAFGILLLPALLLAHGCQDAKNTPAETPIQQKIMTDEEYEKKFKLTEFLDRQLTKVETIHGQAFTTEKDCCKPKGKVKFTFDKGYSGEFPYLDKRVIGMYVKITMQPDENCCKHIKIIQIKRSYTIGDKPRNWQIDAPGDSPYAADYDFAREGINGKPAQVFDIPGRDKGTKKRRVEYMTIVLCAEEGKKDKPLAYVHWGFDLNDKSEVKPMTPEAQCGTPDGLETAVKNWNRAVGVLKGRTAANIDFSD